MSIERIEVPCPFCGGPVPPSLGRGAPRVYCSRECQVAMHRKGTGRTPGSGVLNNRARSLVTRISRAQERREFAEAEIDHAERELTELHAATQERFGRDVPANALLLDVLDLITVEEGDRWLWTGLRNNKNLPTVRVDGAEKSLTRFLAVEFGVISDEDFGTLYPAQGDVDDVNPWHRVLRAAPEPIGNRWRFQPREVDPS